MSENNSSYTPFARKYRPSSFYELLGQEVLVKTLTYCIQNNRLSQAHLLTGIRGVGKTSSARIIAKTVNCTDLQISEDQIIPCHKCKNCESFNNHNHPDIIEIDAASKTSVDDIREIIESSEYKPLLGKRKFFIIDEVHMLSKSAFNALLKVVEEPPEHVIFIFATTEVQKIPLTVISRCQRYDLRRLTFNEIHTLTSNIAKKENITFEEEALRIISIKSEGSARDAVTMLDQAASYVNNTNNPGTITAETVSEMLGLLNSDIIIKFVQLIIANSPASAIELLERIYAKASSLEYFIQTMADFMAELSKSKVIPNYHIPLYSNYSTEISNILIGTSLSRITILWQIFSNGAHEIKKSHNELVTAQMLIIKAIYACNLPSVEEIMDADNNGPIISDGATSSNNSEAIPAIKSIDNIFKFLRYCHEKSEMEIYYLLLNEVEIQEFSEAKVVIATTSNINIRSQIEKMLKSWSDKDWEIVISKQNNIISLKEKLLQQVKQAGDYQLIKNKFPDANISDIILQQ